MDNDPERTMIPNGWRAGAPRCWTGLHCCLRLQVQTAQRPRNHPGIGGRSAAAAHPAWPGQSWPALRWLDRQAPAGDQVVELTCVAGQPEEPILLRNLLRLGAILRAPAAGELGGLVELLATDTIQPLILLAVQVAGV